MVRGAAERTSAKQKHSVSMSDLTNCFAEKNKQALLQGYGIGLSWGACITNLNNTICIEPETYGGSK